MITGNGSHIHLIEAQQEFEELCSKWRSEKFLAIDTEFIRTNTFYPKLGLLQIADTNNCYLIDPLCISDWSPFAQLLNLDIEFCIHSCSEDLNLLHTSISMMPREIFDSQLAAAFLGLGYSLSYQGLVKLLLGEEIPKDETRSDWLKRPLTDTQLQYAANDVSYLLALREALWEQLKSKDVLQWFEEECVSQTNLATEIENEESWKISYTMISNAWKLDDGSLSRLREICYWRELKAREKNKPKNWIAKDNDLFNIASIKQDLGTFSSADLESITFSDRRFIGRYGDEILNLLNNPNMQQICIDRSLLNFPLRPALRKQLKACQYVVSSLAEKLSVAPELLARKRLLQNLVRDYESFGELRWEGDLSGWRKELLEPEINPLFG